MKKIISVSLERKLVDSIDERKGLISRSQYIETLLRGFKRAEEKEAEVSAGYA